jgi:ribosomal protein S18 acetylase RimI-like enzyme
MAIHVYRLDCARPEIAAAIVRIQKDAYAVEAAIIGQPDLPPLRETVRDIQESSEDFYGCYHQNELTGVISLACETSEVLVCRLVVAPKSFRRGIGSALLSHAESQSRCKGLYLIKVNTAARNRPALALYRKHGFQTVSAYTTPDGVPLVALRKVIDQCDGF